MKKLAYFDGLKMIYPVGKDYSEQDRKNRELQDRVSRTYRKSTLKYVDQDQ